MNTQKHKKPPLISIIIIAEKWNHYLEESLPYYKKLNYDNFEVFLFSTEDIKKKLPNITYITEPSLKNKPAERRDLCMKYANGDIYAFIDDDAFPTPNWLNEAVKDFEDENVTAVGGPGIDPKSASLMERASGWTSASPLGGFGSTYRFIPQQKKEIDDYPTMNLLVRAKDFKAIGGFDSNYYPGEDTKLCLDLTHKLKKKIIYEPKAIVYHHKRPLFKKHLLQNGRFGLHRGHFAHILPETSRRWFYFIPSLFSIGFLGGLIFTLLYIFVLPSLLFFDFIASLYMMVIGIYFLMLTLNAVWVFLKTQNSAISLLTILGVFTTHIWYGLKFIQGYFSPDMNDDYGRSEGDG